jgi:hypothetical protein
LIFSFIYIYWAIDLGQERQGAALRRPSLFSADSQLLAVLDQSVQGRDYSGGVERERKSLCSP